MAPPQIVAIRPLKYPDRTGIWKCWFLRRGENRSTWGKTSRAEKRTNNKLNPHTASGPRIDPKSHWWEASALTTAPSLLPIYKIVNIINSLHTANLIEEASMKEAMLEAFSFNSSTRE